MKPRDASSWPCVMPATPSSSPDSSSGMRFMSKYSCASETLISSTEFFTCASGLVARSSSISDWIVAATAISCVMPADMLEMELLF